MGSSTSTKVHTLSLVNPSMIMERQLGRKRPKGHTKWLYEDWINYHDKLVECINEREHSKEHISWLDSVPKKFYSKCGNFTAHTLTSRYDIATEGHKMHHCVASFIGGVCEGKYIIVSIRDSNGERVSTLSLRKVGHYGVKFIWQRSQHCGHSNGPIFDISVHKFSDDIVKTTNEYYNVNKQECI
jgi:hypothetical protein